MTPHQYLERLLQQQAMPQGELATLRRLRDEIEGKLRSAYGSGPRCYYGGSFGKNTMIRVSYDLDIVIYFPSTERASLRDIFNDVHGELTRNGYVVQPKTVALRLPYEEGFHIDVVPGRAQDSAYQYATLYKNVGLGSTLQTSLKVHIDAIRKTGVRDIIKLMKLWRVRHSLSWSTFALEITAQRALDGRSKADLDAAMLAVFDFVAGNLQRIRLVDPANTNNEIEMSLSERNAVVAKARQSLNAPDWAQIIW
jgi:hypothetical protein